MDPVADLFVDHVLTHNFNGYLDGNSLILELKSVGITKYQKLRVFDKGPRHGNIEDLCFKSEVAN